MLWHLREVVLDVRIIGNRECLHCKQTSADCRWCRGLTESRPRSLLAWDWLDAAHTYESSLAPGRIGAVLLLLWRFAALLLFAIGLLYQEYADSKGNPKDEGLTPTYFTFFTNWYSLRHVLFKHVTACAVLTGPAMNTARCRFCVPCSQPHHVLHVVALS